MSHLKIIVVAGPSGGHIFPALGFLEAVKLKGINTDTLLVLPKIKTVPGRETLGYKTRYVSISNVSFSFKLEGLISIWRFFQGAFESLFIILLFRPSIVVGFGSVVSIPLILFARALGIKTIIHEQNVVAGRANKFLANFVDQVAVSFSSTKDKLGNFSKKAIVTGNPIRQELIGMDKNKALSFFGFGNDKTTILVMGGSTGSHRINLEFFRAITTMPDRNSLQVIHLTGAEDYDLLKNHYQGLDSYVRLFGFLNSMQYAYNAADLVVCRAGATTIAEIIFFKLPAIIVPYPYAYQHQLANAEFLGENGCAMIIEENEFDAAMLKLVLGELVNNSARLKQMRDQYATIPSFNARELLASAACSLANM